MSTPKVLVVDGIRYVQASEEKDCANCDIGHCERCSDENCDCAKHNHGRPMTTHKPAPPKKGKRGK